MKVFEADAGAGCPAELPKPRGGDVEAGDIQSSGGVRRVRSEAAPSKDANNSGETVMRRARSSASSKKEGGNNSGEPQVVSVTSLKAGKRTKKRNKSVEERLKAGAEVAVVDDLRVPPEIGQDISPVSTLTPRCSADSRSARAASSGPMAQAVAPRRSSGTSTAPAAVVAPASVRALSDESYTAYLSERAGEAVVFHTSTTSILKKRTTDRDDCCKKKVSWAVTTDEVLVEGAVSSASLVDPDAKWPRPDGALRAASSHKAFEEWGSGSYLRRSGSIDLSGKQFKDISAAAWRRRRIRKFLKPLTGSLAFKAVSSACLLFALLGNVCFILADVPDDPGIVIVDVLMTLIFAFFMLEIILYCIVLTKAYINTAYFWMDILGTLSMVFEISFLLGSAGKQQIANGTVDTVVLRAARAAKMGARVGRLSKTMKCLTSFQKKDEPKMAMEQNELKWISRHLMRTLSTRVALLSLSLLLISPLFDLALYPAADFSMRVWADNLERGYAAEVQFKLLFPDDNTSEHPARRAFTRQVRLMSDFYGELNYFPFNIDGFGPTVLAESGDLVQIELPPPLQGSTPVRRENIVMVKVQECITLRPGCDGFRMAYVVFDFTSPKKNECLMDLGLVVLLVFLMAATAFNLSRMLERQVLEPLHRMFRVVRLLTSSILEQVTLIDTAANDEDNADPEINDKDVSEIKLLEVVLSKLAKLSAIFTESNVVSDREMDGMYVEGRGIILDIMQLGKREGDRKVALINRQRTIDLRSDQLVVVKLPVDEEVVDSWNFDVLSMEDPDVLSFTLYLFFDSKIGQRSARTYTDVATFQHFQHEVKVRYENQPYHNYLHACDVLHTVYRLLMLTASESWALDIEQYALMISALAHDIGHFGRTNAFLIETQHELALRYNDSSPLENMHCASLFAICSNTPSNVFRNLERDKYTGARKVCISTILHTDNVHHFDMVKDISKIYELNTGLCDKQAGGQIEDESYTEEVLRQNQSTWLQMFLHIADVSNPLKPFDLCRVWAHRVLDEFFNQGDEEKALGIPVGMLNDRDTVCRLTSQHGFINFLVAPLVFRVVSVFPMLIPFAENMTTNLQRWRDTWIKETHPMTEDIFKREADISKAKETLEQLRQRGWAQLLPMAAQGQRRRSRV